jgi:hypothetical protein
MLRAGAESSTVSFAANRAANETDDASYTRE